jgi:hypothetical protein
VQRKRRKRGRKTRRRELPLRKNEMMDGRNNIY